MHGVRAIEQSTVALPAITLQISLEAVATGLVGNKRGRSDRPKFRRWVPKCLVLNRVAAEAELNTALGDSCRVDRRRSGCTKPKLADGSVTTHAGGSHTGICFMECERFKTQLKLLAAPSPKLVLRTAWRSSGNRE